jgi:hypothetical protein
MVHVESPDNRRSHEGGGSEPFGRFDRFHRSIIKNVELMSMDRGGSCLQPATTSL